MSSCEWWSSWNRQSMRDAVVREVHGPVAAVHGDDDQRDRSPPRHEADPGQDDPRERRAGDVHHREGEAGHERHDQGRVHQREEQVMAVPASEDRTRLRRPGSLHDEEHADDRQGRRTGHDRAQADDRAGEVGTAPAGRPTHPEQDPGGDRDHTGGEVDARRDRGPQAARGTVAPLHHAQRGSTGGLDYPGGHGRAPVSTRATRRTRLRCRRCCSAWTCRGPSPPTATCPTCR